MTEHVHEWVDEYNGSLAGWFVCEICKKQMQLCDALPMLNATERLSAEAAKDIVAWSGGNNKHVMDMTNWYALKAYADILEGK